MGSMLKHLSLLFPRPSTRLSVWPIRCSCSTARRGRRRTDWSRLLTITLLTSNTCWWSQSWNRAAWGQRSPPENRRGTRDGLKVKLACSRTPRNCWCLFKITERCVLLCSALSIWIHLFSILYIKIAAVAVIKAKEFKGASVACHGLCRIISDICYIFSLWVHL